MASDDGSLPTLVPLVAYSTGLILGRFLVDIIADLLDPPRTQGNRMSTAGAAVLELLENAPDASRPWETAVFSEITLAKDYPHPARVLSDVEASMWAGLQEITAPTVKAEILAVLARLPDDCSIEDIVEELDEREHLRRGLASAIYEPRISQAEMEAWFEQWARE